MTEQNEQSWYDQATDWAQQQATDAAQWAQQTATEAGEWVTQHPEAATTGDVGWGYGDQQAEVAQSGAGAAVQQTAEQVTDSVAIEDERIAQDVYAAKQYLAGALSAAHATAETLHASWPEVDTGGCRALAGQLHELSEYAAAAGYRAGTGHSAQGPFYTARDEAQWASNLASQAADLPEQQSTALEQLPATIAAALAATQTIP